MLLSDVYHLLVINGKTVWMASFPLDFLSKDEISVEYRMSSLKLNKKEKKKEGKNHRPKSSGF